MKVGTDTWTFDEPEAGSLIWVGLEGSVERGYVLPSTMILILAGPDVEPLDWMKVVLVSGK